MDGNDAEACGRCAMTTVVDTAGAADEDGGPDPFGDERIEVPEDQLRTISRPQVWASRVKHRLDEFATRLTYGR